MNLEQRMAAVRLRIGDAVGLLLYLDAQPLGEIAPIEGILPLVYSQKNRQRPQQQNSRHQHQRPHPLYRESHAQFAAPNRAASLCARLSPSSLHKSRAVAPEPFSTPAVSSTSWRTFSSTCRA